MPASKAVRLLSTARYGSVRLQPEVVYFKKPGGNLKENLQKGGYRDFSRKILPLPRLAAYPTLTAQSTTSAPTAINYSSKLMSAAQELFQLFLKVYFNPASRPPFQLLLRSTAKPE
jgi:hypothetical protein